MQIFWKIKRDILPKSLISILVEIFFYKTAFYIADENGNADIIKLLLSHPKIDVNDISI